MRKKQVWACLLFLLVATFAGADTLIPYGNVTNVPCNSPNGGCWLIQSNSSLNPSFGGILVQVTSGLTLNGLSNLSATYEMLNGTGFGGGSPRFTPFDGSFNGAYLYWGTNNGGCSMSDPHAGSNTLNSTGNLVGNAPVDLAGFGGQSAFCQSYANFLATVDGSTPITYISLDLDGGFQGTQSMLLSSFCINDHCYTAPAQQSTVPEPASALLLATGLCAVLFRKKL